MRDLKSTMKYRLKKRYSEAKAFPLPKELQIDGHKLSASILSKQSPEFLKNFQTNVAIGDYYGLTKHPDSRETADSSNWKTMHGGEPGTLGRYHMNQIRRMNDGEMSGSFDKELPILHGSLNFSENKRRKTTMKYKLKRADRIYMEGYKAAVIDMLREGHFDDAKKALGINAFGEPYKSNMLKFNRDDMKRFRRNSAKDGIPPWDSKTYKDVQSVDPDMAEKYAFLNSDAGREIDGEFDELF